METQLRDKAIEIAQKITGKPGEDDNTYFVGSHWQIQYRPQWNDWVTWYFSQLEGTNRGNDEAFVKWGEQWLKTHVGN